jgi:hypothetical protein
VNADKELVEEMVYKAVVDGSIGVLVREVEEQGQAFRKKVELALRSKSCSRREEKEEDFMGNELLVVEVREDDIWDEGFTPLWGEIVHGCGHGVMGWCYGH